MVHSNQDQTQTEPVLAIFAYTTALHFRKFIDRKLLTERVLELLPKVTLTLTTVIVGAQMVTCTCPNSTTYTPHPDIVNHQMLTALKKAHLTSN